MITYRYIQRKRAESKNPQLRVDRQKTSTTKANWGWRLKLAIALAIPIFFETLDYTVVATAQTLIASTFGRLDLQSYIGTAYLLTSTVFLPLFASIADIFGRYVALQLSLLFFIFGSALSTGAQNIETMLAGRGIAGVGAAGLLTVVRVIMADSSSLDDNNWQVSVLFLLYAIGYSVGPIIGGALANVSFRWIFAINLPASILAMALCFLLLRKHTKGGQPSKRLPLVYRENETVLLKLLRIDWIGTVLFTVAGILILLALNWGSTEEWNSAKVIVSFIVGGLLAIAFVLWEYCLMHHDTHATSTSHRGRLFWADPTIPLELFRSYDICVVQAASFVGGMVMIVMFYFVAIFMTIVSGLSPKDAGVQLVYFAPGSGGGTLLAVYIVKYLRQPKYAIILGSLLIPVALGMVSVGIHESKQNWVNGFMVMTGVGCGLTIGSVNVQARFTQSKERVAIVAALILFFRSFGGTVGLAQCAAVLNARVGKYIQNAVASGTISGSDLEDLASASVHSGGLTSLQSISDLPPGLQTVIRDAFREGTRWSFISLIPWAAVVFFLTLGLSNIPDTDGKQLDTPSQEDPVELNGLSSDHEQRRYEAGNDGRTAP
ncbi:MFS general substrate transporter [Dendrothele bispora CBS 962.96]|uniref:MFS general substrate transporter n=1 Tax=Dendrothele bispora (strain CBS 962.96) TaxID=1314807 RepID=A0A4S8M0S9_DENBC|nr:MFS general substrate transporter [Dendrothele bispora CBS 962.96]